MKKFKIRKKETFLGKIFTFLVRIFKKPAELVNTTANPVESKAIFAANHCGARGPFNLTNAFKKAEHPAMIWSAWQCGGNFFQRWSYLYHIFYRQKLHYSRTKSFLLASLLAPIYFRIFRYAGLLPVYHGIRLKKTYNYTTACLDENVSVVIFPENSSKGYEELPKEFFKGFLVAAKIYLQTRGSDVPIYPLYYCPAKKSAFVGEPLYYGEMSGIMTEEEMCAEFVHRIVDLAAKYGSDPAARDGLTAEESLFAEPPSRPVAELTM